MKRYLEINIGDREQLTHTITQKDIEKFVDLTGDDNKLHVDEAFAKTTQFKKPVVHGMLGASFISTIIGTKMPGDGALWFSQTLEFRLPVRVGDKLTITAEVVKKNDKESIIELDTEIINQNRQVVTKGLAKVKIIESETSSELDKPEEGLSIRTALIIGGTGGIGSATCRQLAKDGLNVIVHYNRNEELANQIVSEIKDAGGEALKLQGDILNESDIKNLVQQGLRKFGRIDALVNCAATVIPNIKFHDLRWEDYLTQTELNIKSSFLLAKELTPHMQSYGKGKIVFIGSLSSDKPNAEWSHYITAKSALIGLTRSLAFELSPRGINVNMVTPSLVSTELTADIPEKIKLKTAAQTPLRRLASTLDVAGAISFLISDRSDFVTGENLRINGGQVMN
jgi:3-oxoacyl-[acyl-carrier protein] reductase